MSKKTSTKLVSIRVRLEPEIIVRIDLHAGESGRQQFIRDAILGRLDETVPPAVLDLIGTVEDLRERVKLLERAGASTMSLGPMSDDLKTKVCRDDFDRQILSFIIEHRGATTTDLERALGGRRRTILDRIYKLNERAEKILGGPVLEHVKGEHKGKKGAWWPTKTIYS